MAGRPDGELGFRSDTVAGIGCQSRGQVVAIPTLDTAIGRSSAARPARSPPERLSLACVRGCLPPTSDRKPCWTARVRRADRRCGFPVRSCGKVRRRNLRMAAGHLQHSACGIGHSTRRMAGLSGGNCDTTAVDPAGADRLQDVVQRSPRSASGDRVVSGDVVWTFARLQETGYPIPWQGDPARALVDSRVAYVRRRNAENRLAGLYCRRAAVAQGRRRLRIILGQHGVCSKADQGTWSMVCSRF